MITPLVSRPKTFSASRLQIRTKQVKICCWDNNTSRFNIAYKKKYKPKFDTLNDCSLRFTSENDFHTSVYNVKNEKDKDLLRDNFFNTYFAFEPSQIKSATGNNGTWNLMMTVFWLVLSLSQNLKNSIPHLKSGSEIPKLCTFS